MKNYIFLLLSVLSLISCDDIEKNDPALQANIDDRFYASADARAFLNGDGSLTVEGITQQESLTLQLSSLAEGNFRIGEEASNYAVFEDFGGNIYNTRPDGTGMVTISEVNETNKTITGTFHFNAILPGIDTIYVSKGFLHNVSYTAGENTDPNNIFNAKVDDNTFTTVSISATDTDGNIVVSGVGTDATIIITVPNDVEPEEYTLLQSGFNAKYQDADGPETTEQGTITILEHDTTAKTIKAAFSFSTDQSEITMGNFNVTY
ncbi:DUF6252 family protein [Aequorivita marina]|uniref:DUF6252 family protein n=1 Tax=Aequorivita marina TaxID=3073654 RepID=UPI00287675D2|nr:DUF6252 family protein [Aequorivita sp. S2608]MDS1299754.1 DUF6252 family protein [Aequorivita sp. S2608]